jgi:biopolymer transport protein ExbD
MAKKRFLDVWIVELNKVYTEVPFATVADWAQQGRLLEDDMVRPSGTSAWQRLGGSTEFAPYLPQPEPLRPDDQAEALAPVGLDVHWKRPHEEEDEDVDMIPLIDVSLVLLIFFIMTTATAAAAAMFVPTPEAREGGDADKPGALRVDVNLDKDGDTFYAIGWGSAAPAAEDSEIYDFQQLMGRLRVYLTEAPGEVELVINAHKDLRAKYARDLLLELSTRKAAEAVAARKAEAEGKPPTPRAFSKVSVNYYGVSQREP